MAVIRLLSDNLINRIAAGEVVERPASVLKELLENSLDAGADRIEVEAERGGRRLISVADNGKGMDPDDLLLSVERHATSKLQEETDLLHIDTLGFRGEALASIGAVSRLNITSSDNERGEGRQVRMSGGRVMGVDEAARERGTTVVVEDLFFNVPARRKFLKAVNTEAAHILEMVQRYALSRPDLRLVYRHNGQELLSTSPKEDRRSRLAKVLGREAAGRMIEFSGVIGDVSLSGYLGPPDLDRSRASALYLFVLGRPVRDRLLTRSVLEAYRGRLAQGRYPAAVVFLDIDPSLVDVNVHPAKAEVRFRRPGDVYLAAADIMAGALAENLRPMDRTYPSPPGPAEGYRRHDPPPADYPSLDFFQSGGRVRESFVAPEAPVAAVDLPPVPWPPREEEAATPDQAGELRPVGQVYRSYILAQDRKGVCFVDQHAAHERILYEKLQDDLAGGDMPSQALLVPETIEPGPTRADLLTRLAPALARFGFQLEPFGGNTWVVRAVPAVLAGRNAVGALEEIIDQADELDPGRGLARVEEHILSTLACHAALKANQTLTGEEMDRLLADLARTRVPTNCPHGRPLIFRIDRSEIEKRFKRS